MGNRVTRRFRLSRQAAGPWPAPSPTDVSQNPRQLRNAGISHLKNWRALW